MKLALHYTGGLVVSVEGLSGAIVVPAVRCLDAAGGKINEMRGLRHDGSPRYNAPIPEAEHGASEGPELVAGDSDAVAEGAAHVARDADPDAERGVRALDGGPPDNAPVGDGGGGRGGAREVGAPPQRGQALPGRAGALARGPTQDDVDVLREYIRGAIPRYPHPALDALDRLAAAMDTTALVGTESLVRTALGEAQRVLVAAKRVLTALDEPKPGSMGAEVVRAVDELSPRLWRLSVEPWR